MRESKPRPAVNLDPDEQARFAASASQWWREDGPYAPLHHLNPVRLAYIRDQIQQHFDLPGGPRLLSGLHLADIGCGGGLVCEPMTRLGAHCIGVDATEAAIIAARDHAAARHLTIDYRCTTAETLQDEGHRFDIVLALEIIEHVPSPAAFIECCAALLKPSGIVILSTLNRTLQSWLLAIIGAEYVLRMLPVGTHHWDRFVTPAEMQKALTNAGLIELNRRGCVYHPLDGAWHLSDDVGVNYFMTACNSPAAHGFDDG